MWSPITVFTAISSCLLFISICDAFNLETRLPVIKNGVRNSYFGYSVAQHLIIDKRKGNVGIMLVGAPKAQSEQRGTDHSGVVYKCLLTTHRRDCVPLRIDQEEDGIEPDPNVSKDDQWLGVTVKSQGPGGFVMVCAHRYVLKGTDFRWGFGICYSLSSFLDYQHAWEPCLNRPVAKAHEEFGFCQAGTSGDISEDNEIIIGAPGPYTWRGTIFKNSVKFGIRDDRTWYFGPLDNASPVDKYSYLGMSVASGKFFGPSTSYASGAPRANGTGRVVLFNKQKKNTTLEVKLILNGEQFASSFGYTMTTLDCNGDNKPDLIIGAPFYYTEDEGGAVYIYLNTGSSFNSTHYSLKLTGKTESRFGFSLTNLGDINKDGFQDLAIGAPYEGNGAVYVYLGSVNGIKPEYSQVIHTSDLPKDGRAITTFGYSLSGSQDLDENGYPDLLIGAYESDAVVLLRARPILDIVTSVSVDVRSIDPNKLGCNDDPTSKLTCFSVEACFKFNSTHTIGIPVLNLQYRIEAEFGKRYYRVKFNSSAESDTPNVVERDIILTRNNNLQLERCSKELVYIKDKSDIQNPIKFKLTYSLIQKEPRIPKEGESLPELYPILNQEEAQKIFEARFLKDCGTNDICESSLEVKAQLELPREEHKENYVLYLGEEDVNITVNVINRNEPAYDANVFIIHPESLNFRKTEKIKGDQVECIPQNTTLLRCELGNPFKKGEVEIFVRFTPKETLGDISKLEIAVEANTTSKDISPQKNFIKLEAKVVRMAELELKGYADHHNVMYGGEVIGESAMKKEDDIGSVVTQSYVVHNRGPWKAKRVEIVIQWPFEVENGRENGKWIFYLMEKPIVQDDGYCELEDYMVNRLHLEKSKESDTVSSNKGSRVKREMVVLPEKIEEDGKVQNIVILDCKRGTAKCYEFSCFVNNLRAGQNAVVKIRARLWNPTFVEDYAHGINQVHIISHASLKLDPILDIEQRKDNDFASAKTKAIPDLPSLPAKGPSWWIILLAILLGILLLLIVIFILWKIGFFKRRKPVDGYMPADTDDKDINSYG